MITVITLMYSVFRGDELFQTTDYNEAIGQKKLWEIEDRDNITMKETKVYAILENGGVSLDFEN